MRGAQVGGEGCGSGLILYLHLLLLKLKYFFFLIIFLAVKVRLSLFQYMTSYLYCNKKMLSTTDQCRIHSLGSGLKLTFSDQADPVLDCPVPTRWIQSEIDLFQPDGSGLRLICSNSTDPV